ncbi:MAG: tRNA-uridine 2-sulfurtransferase [Methylobacteriaceae bacterium]|jgi:tRNA-specific 2-thiouridylase|nr:tRNA-uridine 2-sulfurtransferase [Methylobacteriaceae bacterium]
MNPLPPPNNINLNSPPADTRIVVAMSGGVDSSVVAALLKQQGYNVVGVTMQLYDYGATVARGKTCCAGRDVHDARDVAARLAIPHYVLDFESRFRERVIIPFAEAYASGSTPVPCIACNQNIKFADLFDIARDLDADALATGHYVQSRREADGSRGLYRARDAGRDQSYFLFTTTAAQLDFVRFPLGGYTKQEVRGLARDFGLPVAEKHDSQDICFVPEGHYSDVVSRLRPEAAIPGNVVDLDGRILGRHAGVIHYTIGQRRGLGLDDRALKGEPRYVVRLDAARAEVIVGPRAALATKTIALRDVNWVGPGSLDDLPKAGLQIAVRVRSTRPPAPALLEYAAGCARVSFSAEESGVAPGQACVFYDSVDPRARVLGGGFIVHAEAASANPPAAARAAAAG